MDFLKTFLIVTGICLLICAIIIGIGYFLVWLYGFFGDLAILIGIAVVISVVIGGIIAANVELMY